MSENPPPPKSPRPGSISKNTILLYGVALFTVLCFLGMVLIFVEIERAKDAAPLVVLCIAWLLLRTWLRRNQGKGSQ